MRVLVTGSSGFIGSQVAWAVSEAGHDVRCVDLRAAEAADVADVRDVPAMVDALDGVDTVVHLAAKVGLEQAFADAPDYLSHNGCGTGSVLAAAAAAGVGRIVLASSMVVYGEGLSTCDTHGRVRPGPRRPADLDARRFEPRCPLCDASTSPALVDENVPMDPRNVYATTKVLQEHLLAAWARQTGATGAAMRFHNVYGPGAPRDNPYSGVASLFLSDVLAHRAPRVTEDGGQRRDFVHVRDVARACVAALDPPTPAPAGSVRAYNVASGRPRTVLDLATALAAAGGGPPPVVTGSTRLGDVRHITASAERAAGELGWSAHEEFEESLAELVRDVAVLARDGSDHGPIRPDPARTDARAGL